MNLADQVSKRAARHLRAFRREVEGLMPDRVTDVVLFGSRARGDAKRGSDYDVAVLMDRLGDRRIVDHALSDAAYEHILAGIHIRPVALSIETQANRDAEGFAINVARDGIRIE